MNTFTFEYPEWHRGIRFVDNDKDRATTTIVAKNEPEARRKLAFHLALGRCPASTKVIKIKIK